MGIELKLDLTCGGCGTMITIHLWSIEIIKKHIKDSGWEYIYQLSEGKAEVYCPKCRVDRKDGSGALIT